MAEILANRAALVFDAVSWADTSDRDVLRAFLSLVCRRRFFAVTDESKLVELLRASLDSQEDITDALGVQVRQAVELLIAAIGRADVAARQRGERGLEHVDAHEVYRGAVTVMRRVVFLFFAEERGLLPRTTSCICCGPVVRRARAACPGGQ